MKLILDKLSSSESEAKTALEIWNELMDGKSRYENEPVQKGRSIYTKKFTVLKKILPNEDQDIRVFLAKQEKKKQVKHRIRVGTILKEWYLA